MAFVPIPFTVRAVLRFQQGTDERQTVLHYKTPGRVPTNADLLSIAQTLVDWWDDVGKLASSTTLALFEVVCTSIHSEGGIQLSQPVSPPITGSLAEPPEPGNVTSTISWRTARTGRRYRGRTFWPGYTDASTNNDGTVSSAQVIRLIAAGANLLFGYVPGDMVLAVASKVAGASEPVIRSIVENVLDSMRRRLPKRGI